MKILQYFLLFFIIILISCSKNKDEKFTVSPNLNEYAYSKVIKDSTLVLNNILLKYCDFDNDSIPDLEFSLEERNGEFLQFQNFKIKALNDCEIAGKTHLDSICTDSIYFTRYQFYIFRLHNCNSIYAERVDTNFCAEVNIEYEEFELKQFSTESVLYFNKYYYPTIYPDIITEDIQIGNLKPDYKGYILIRKGQVYYLLGIIWNRPFFIIEDIRKLRS